MEFAKEILIDMALGFPETGYKIIENKIVDTTRWSKVYRMIFRFEDKFYSSLYQCGATEYQDEEPYEYEDDMIECTEVFPVEKTIIVYEAKKK